MRRGEVTVKAWSAAIALLLSALVGLPALSAPPFVVDRAGLFSSEAVREAEAKLLEVERRTGKTVRVETLPALPPGRSATEEAAQRFRELRLNGVLVLVARRERAIAIQVGRFTAEQLTPDERRAVLERMRSRFRARDFNGGLREAVDSLSRALLDSSSASPAEPLRRWFPLLLAVAGAVLLYLALRRTFEPEPTHPPQSAEHPVSPGSGWGGFGGGLLGGLFGAWLGHALLGGPRTSEPPPPLQGSEVGWTQDDAGLPADSGEAVIWGEPGADLEVSADVGDADATQW